MNMAMHKIRLMLGLLLCVGLAHAQDKAAEEAQKLAEKALRESTNLTWEANKELTANDFVDAEAEYRKAISKSDKNAAAPFNLGNAYYNRESYGEAFGRYKQAGEAAEDKAEKHKAFHNMGNVFMKNKEYEKAVEAYKEALRNNPNDEETRYNLALAKKMLEKQQDEQKNDQNQDNKDNQDQQDQKDQNQDQNKDQNNEGGDNDKQDEGKQDQDQNKDQGDQGENGEDKPEENQKGDGDEKKEQEKKPNEGDEPQDQKQQPRPNQLSQQQIQNLLEAMQNEEKKVQEKMEARKVRGKKVKNEKDW